MNEELLTVIDIGTGKLFGLTARVKEGEPVSVEGVVSLPMEAEVMKKGRVINMDGLYGFLCDLLDQLKKQTGARISFVVISVGGGHIQGKVYRKAREMEPRGREIQEADILALERDIRAIASAEQQPGRRILPALSAGPREYVVDGQPTHVNPLGRRANTLEVRMHIVSGEFNPIQDLIRCVQSVGVRVERIFPGAWAAAEAVVKDEERSLGCLVIDLGKGTTNAVHFADRMVVTTLSCPYGGANIDGDIAHILRTPLQTAEDLKKQHGWCSRDRLLREHSALLAEEVLIPSPSGIDAGRTTVDRISEIVVARVREIMEVFVRGAICGQGRGAMPNLAGGVVLCGGCAHLHDIEELCTDIFGYQTRVGHPSGAPGLEPSYQMPEYAAGIGLLRLAAREMPPAGRQKSLLTKVWDVLRRSVS